MRRAARSSGSSIGSVGPGSVIGVSSSSRDFAALAAYLARGRDDDTPDRVAWTVSRNIPTDDPDVSATIMHASAARNARVAKPVYHLAISFDPGDRVDRATMEHVADRILGALGLSEHQALIVAHQDREHPHLHLMVNRVHPETGLAWSRWQDQRVVQRVLREEELALGLRQVPGRLAATPQLDAFARLPEVAHPAASPIAVSLASEGASVELARSVQALEHELAVRSEHLASHIAVQSARARLGELDTAVRRASRAAEELQRALGAVYRDPAAAHAALKDEIRRIGVADTLALLKHQPARFGALSTRRKRWLGILYRDDTGSARRSAPYLAGKAYDAIEADRTVRALASAGHIRAADEQFTRALAVIYADADAARLAFERLAHTRGDAHAMHVLGAEPQALGRLRATPGPNGRHEPSVAGAVIAGRQFLAARAAASIGQQRETPSAVDPFARALAAARSDVRNALVEHNATRPLSRSVHADRHPDRRIRQTIARLLPSEVARLSLALSKPARALVAKVRRAVRDAILERDQEAG